MERPVRPDPAECPRIKKAMRAARIMKWGAEPVALIGQLAALIVGVTSKWYFGVAVLVVIVAPFFIFVILAARCPRCGSVWWSFGPVATGRGGSEDTEDETESMVCRECRLDIGYGLRE